MRYMKFFKRFLSEGPRETSRHRINWPVRGVILVFLMNPVTPLVLFGVEQAWPAEPVNPLTREYTITVDPTGLEPPTRWHVPGITPLIWTGDPASTEAYRTTEPRAFKLKPGEYRFGTFTFDFAFRVTLDGLLEFSPALSQCVEGRGKNTLTVRCSHTQPYKQEPEYYD